MNTARLSPRYEG